MKFKDSFFYFSIVRPIKSWKEMSLYYIALGLPLMLFMLAGCLLVVIPVDGFFALREVARRAA